MAFIPTGGTGGQAYGKRLNPSQTLKVVNIMENFDRILQAISTTGFPIIVCLILMWYVNKQLDTHKEETNALKDVIAENTAMLQKLTIMIEGKYKGE